MTNKDLKIKTGWNLDNSYAKLPEFFYKKVYPTPVSSPFLIILNNQLAEFLGLNIEELNSQESVFTFAGNSIPEGSIPIAQAYAGHQFGYFTMLGDGRAILLGEQITPSNQRVDIQLKGSGVTPFSRRGDGRAALGPMLREYIISEAMHGLNIPTTRSLSVIETGEPVYRETVLPGAILTRVASSHIRVGTFQYAANFGTKDDVIKLAEYTISRHYPFINNEDDKYMLLLKEVVKRQASLIAKWQLSGFIHGVMNTDNMTISGETIDYGPCAFMDTYNPDTVFSSIDANGRYAYKNQPIIAEWNLMRLAESLVPILHENEERAINVAVDVVSEFNSLFKENYYSGMSQKLGLFEYNEEDVSLIENLLGIMHRYDADYTHTFNVLTENKLQDIVLYENSEFMRWYNQWQERLLNQQRTKEEVKKLMRSVNPSIIPRNYLVEEVLEKAVKGKDYSAMNHLLKALSNPYSDNNEYEEYKRLPTPTTCPYRTYCGT